MKKFTSVMAASLAVCFGANAQLVGEDVTHLIANPSFEEEEVLAGWSVSGPNESRWANRVVGEDKMPHNGAGNQFVWIAEDGGLEPANIVEQWISSDKGEGTYVLSIAVNISRNSWRGNINCWSAPSATYPIDWSRGFLFIDDGTAEDYTTSTHPGAVQIGECGQGKNDAGEGNPQAPEYMGLVQDINPETGEPVVDAEGNPVMVPGMVKGGFKLVRTFFTTDASDLVIGFGIPNDPQEAVDPTNFDVDCLVDGKWVPSAERPEGTKIGDYLLRVADTNPNKNCITTIPKGSMRWDNVKLEFYPTTDIEAVKALYNDSAAVDYVAPAVENGKIYNLQGVEVKEASAPGLYIQNGKKFIVK